MSDTQQGPGWWQAPNGKWYAPEQRAGYNVYVHGAAQPGGPDWQERGGLWFPPPPTPKPLSTTTKWVLGAVALLFGLVILGAILTAGDTSYNEAHERCRQELNIGGDPSFDDIADFDVCLARELDVSVSEARKQRMEN